MHQYLEKTPAPSLEDYIDRTCLEQQGDDESDDENDAVTLITLHGAKGLEFPVVFIAGMEEGFMPYFRPGEASDLEEERRLCYVGVTRAKQRLFLSHARKRRRFGRLVEREPSRFLDQIPSELLEALDPNAPENAGEHEDKFVDFFANIKSILKP